VHRRNVIFEQDLVLEHLTAIVALVMLEVRPQVLPHGLVCRVLLAAHLALDPVELSVLEYVQSQFVLRVEVLAVVVADKVLGDVHR
jgi:hypothetical protein